MAEKEKDKKAFVLRINPALLREVETWAAEEFRSTNGQIEFLLTQAIKSRKRGKKSESPESEDRC
ncbi:Arc family DNA binding domain-containing protein [Pedobacter endophyticus]|uniref:Arc family DNA binding domain-containing protein n=1 Tax=Pedobacter endophyticus TaxID=2789740 RepID=A0A7S9PZY1_9SPHI|nr:Arc family DNA binding domain-containing protein [Pedobacter endophyticus]QPH40132.1 Arc family DNA binding domain-containing protein [Pedobacter endophyticus]